MIVKTSSKAVMISTKLSAPMPLKVNPQENQIIKYVIKGNSTVRSKNKCICVYTKRQKT